MLVLSLGIICCTIWFNNPFTFLLFVSNFSLEEVFRFEMRVSLSATFLIGQLHELCHLKIKEHSHHYWDTPHKYMPNYDDKIEWLKVNEDNLL